MKSVLNTKNLTIGYKTKTNTIIVTKNINIELQQGHLVGLVGANGVGKSTFLRSLAKMQPLLVGEVFLNQKSLNNLSETDLAKTLSLVLTEPLLAKQFSVFELVALGRQPYTNWLGTLTNADKIAVNNALELVKITDLKHKKCYQLSDGQLQKVMIARALAQDTNLIVLDEPTTHLDMYHKAYIIKLLKTLAQTTQKNILFSSHEIELCLQLCDTMLVMQNQNVISGTPSDLIKQGVFNTLFPADFIQFDKKTRRYSIKK